MTTDRLRNTFWVRKMTALFNRLDANKNGVLQEDDLMIYVDRCKSHGRLNKEQSERFTENAKLLWAALSPQGKSTTLEEFIQLANWFVEGKSMRTFMQF